MTLVDIPLLWLVRIARGDEPFENDSARHGGAWQLVALAETVALGHFKPRGV
jgi:hypothetical protein